MNKPLGKWRAQTGSALVEFAIAGMLFITVIFAIVDFSYLLWGNLSMQHAVREGARYAITGRADLDLDPHGTPQDRCDAAIDRIRNQSMGFYALVSPVVSFKTVNSDGSIVPVPANSCAVANQIVVISLNCSLAPLTPIMGIVGLFSPGGRYSFVVSATMKNEAF